jgi:hypothetical protein
MAGEHCVDYGSGWEAMSSIADKIGGTARTLRKASAYFAMTELGSVLPHAPGAGIA